ncbi:hypothetical protein CRENPOLYSF1_100005 [Crenothrix polyspora]|uniref:Uncharacterized protein n=1 Tax=Crenothrix polyspora TaxID=360316 RepID=A0A1R4GYM7_9GAMM|nr:hypothetical protein CRENPOLYSF1_100005 [Crenothrix polyspora]
MLTIATMCCVFAKTLITQLDTTTHVFLLSLFNHHAIKTYLVQLNYTNRQPGNWEIGKLGNWEIGKLGNWEIGKLGNYNDATQIL